MILRKQLNMRNLMPLRFKPIFFFLILLFLCNYSNANNVNIIIDGNKNISIKTIKSLSPVNFDIKNLDSINEYQKNLFASGFFSNIEIRVEKEKLFIKVIENPIVNFFYIEGALKKEMVNNLEKLVSIKENEIFKIFLVKDDLKKISDYLNSIGFLNPEINYSINKLDNNKVNVFYNITLNNQFKINRIFFIGDKKFKTNLLKSVILSDEHGWWKFLSSTTTVSENLVNIDISRLKNFYLNEGYYDAQITSNSVQVASNSTANVIYSISAGNQYFFDKFLINNKTNHLTDKTKIFENFYSNLMNQPYSPNKLIQTVKLFEKFFLDLNLNLNVSYFINKSVNNKISVNFVISENKNQKRINKIVFTGNNLSDDFVIRNFFKFSEGDLFNEGLLLRTVDSLRGSLIFSKADYKVNQVGADQVNLIINVEEKATGEIAAGAGAGSNGATIVGSIKENNFLGKGIVLDSSLNIGTEKIFGKISYSDPDFNQTGNALSSLIFIENNKFDNAAYENKIIGASFTSRYEIFENIFFVPGLGIDQDSVRVGSSASNALQKRRGDFFTSKIFYAIDKNTKNRSFNPTDGYSIGFGQDLSLPISDINYLKNQFYGSYYNSFNEDFIGSIRYKIQSINGINKDIKFSDRLFVNSDNLRGFENRGVGPIMSNEFVGGNNSFYANFSSTFPNGLPDRWNARTNIFYDIANIWGVDDSDISDSNKIRSSIGLGFSWISPLGPISFTYAEPITKSSNDKVEQFNFKIGTAF